VLERGGSGEVFGFGGGGGGGNIDCSSRSPCRLDSEQSAPKQHGIIGFVIFSMLNVCGTVMLI